MSNDNLGDRMKTYETLTTSTMLMPSLPVYARIDGRAFHTFCKGLNKPFCLEFVETMQECFIHEIIEKFAPYKKPEEDFDYLNEDTEIEQDQDVNNE